MERFGPRGFDGPPWGPRRGFGCLFGLLFLVLAGSLVAGVGFVVSQLGPIPGILALSVGIAVLVGMGRTLFRTARALDALVDASRRLEAGDYTVRVNVRQRPTGGLREVDQLTDAFNVMAARLETDERQRRTLLADISHELRTPLTVVQGNIEAIVDGVYPPDAGHLAIVLEETRVLGRLIDDLRTLALSESGTLALHPEATDLEVLIGEVVRSFEPAAMAVGIDLSLEVDGDLPILEIDPVRIREVLANLVANGLRHTPRDGRLTVRAAAEADRIVVEVSDTGRGIGPDLLPHIFERFVTGDAAAGSGLGLAIARQLVVAHGGHISAASTVGDGTTISFWLPITGA
jgi:signal transduction histidine kinase